MRSTAGYLLLVYGLIMAVAGKVHISLDLFHLLGLQRLLEVVQVLWK